MCQPLTTLQYKLPADQIGRSTWLLGTPKLLIQSTENPTPFPLLGQDEDGEIRPKARTLTPMVTSPRTFVMHRFERFSSYTWLVRTIANTQHIARSFQSAQIKKDAEHTLIISVQREVFEEEVVCLRSNKPLPKTSRLIELNPFLDENSLLRVAGRLRSSD